MKERYQIKTPCNKYVLKEKADRIDFNCEVCKKIVKDYTTTEIEYLQEHIESEVNACVKILPSQLQKLNHILTGPRKAIFYGSAIAMMSTSCNSSIIQKFGPEYGKVERNRDSDKSDKTQSNEIRGKVIDAYHYEAIPSASIRIVGSNFEAITDLDGRFRFQVPENIDDSSKLRIGYIGFHRLEIEISKIKGKEIIVHLGERPAIGYLELLR